jgi:hypothetical protein
MGHPLRNALFVFISRCTPFIHIQLIYKTQLDYLLAKENQCHR